MWIPLSERARTASWWSISPCMSTSSLTSCLFQRFMLLEQPVKPSKRSPLSARSASLVRYAFRSISCSSVLTTCTYIVARFLWVQFEVEKCRRKIFSVNQTIPVESHHPTPHVSCFLHPDCCRLVLGALERGVKGSASISVNLSNVFLFNCFELCT